METASASISEGRPASAKAASRATRRSKAHFMVEDRILVAGVKSGVRVWVWCEENEGWTDGEGGIL
jgi:hypothetical protein